MYCEKFSSVLGTYFLSHCVIHYAYSIYASVVCLQAQAFTVIILPLLKHTEIFMSY